jgi:thymidylate kinase
MLIIIDGIDGSGKSTIIKTWAENFAAEGKKVFWLKDYWKEHHRHPKPEELATYDVIVSSEPTTVWAGAAIREEMITHGSTYSTRAIAEAFALDRLILYTRLIIPLRAEGKIIIQDRSVSTSLCYQSLQNPPLSFAENASIEGNALALTNAPDHLVLADISPEKAIERLASRTQKQDNFMYEEKTFLEKVRQQFKNPEYQQYFTNQGTRMHTLNCELPLDIMKQNAIELLNKLMK